MSENKDCADRILLTDRPNSLQYESLRKMNYAEAQILYVGETQLFNSYRRSLLHMGLAPILSYSKFSEEKKSMLFTKHVWISDDNMKPVRIVVLGGSNTDEDVARNKSWPEYLCEYLHNQNISYELYNGGTMGYYTRFGCCFVVNT